MSTLCSISILDATNEEPEGNIKDTVTDLHEATANSHINNAVVKLCLHSYTIQAILEGKESDNDMLRYKEFKNLSFNLK